MKLSYLKSTAALLLAAMFSSGEISAQSAGEIYGERTWYNQLSLRWGLPIAEDTQFVPVGIDHWKPSHTFKVSHSNVFTDGESLYSGFKVFTRYDMEGNQKEVFSIDGLTDVWKTAFDGKYFYMVEWEKKGIYVVDPKERKIVDVISTPSNIYYFDYIPSLDNGKGGFIAGTPIELFFLSKDGTILNGSLDLRPTLGDKLLGQDIVYMGDKLYLYATSPKTIRKVFELDYNKLSFTGKVYDLDEHVGEGGIEADYYSRGMMKYRNPENKQYLMFVDITVKGETMFNATSFLYSEKKTIEGLVGYNIYRDSQKLNEEVIESQLYSYVDSSVVDNQTYHYEIKPVTDQGEGKAFAHADISTEDTRILPFSIDFLRFGDIDQFLNEYYWSVENCSNKNAWNIHPYTHNLQYFHSKDSTYQHMLVSRPYYCEAGTSLKVSIDYSGNTYMGDKLAQEKMILELLEEGAVDWKEVGRIDYKSDAGNFTTAEFDAPTSVAGKNFKLRMRPIGNTEQFVNYTWQFQNIKVWSEELVEVSGKVTYAGMDLNKPMELTAVLETIGKTYTTTTNANGTFDMGSIGKGNYLFKLSDGLNVKEINFDVDHSAGDYVLSFEDARFTTSAQPVNQIMGQNVLRTISMPVVNVGDGSGHEFISVLPESSSEDDLIGNSDMELTPEWILHKSFIPQRDANNFTFFYHDGFLFEKDSNYKKIVLNKYSLDGQHLEDIELQTEGEFKGSSINNYFSDGKNLWVFTNAQTWSKPAVPAYIIPVDLNTKKILDSQKITIDASIVPQYVECDPKGQGFYALNNNQLFLMNHKGEKVETYSLPQAGYKGLAFDTFSKGGPYIWMVKTNYSPAGLILGRYCMKDSTFVPTAFDVNNIPESVFNSASRYANPANPGLTASTQVVPGYLSLIITEGYSERGSKGKFQVLIERLFPIQTWLSAKVENPSLQAGETNNVEVLINTEKLKDGEHRKAKVIISSRNWSEDVLVPIDITVDYEKGRKPITDLKAAVTDDHSVKLTWKSSSDEIQNGDGKYIVYRNDLLLGETTQLSYVDQLPLIGEQTYQIESNYKDGSIIVSDRISIVVDSIKSCSSLQNVEAVVADNKEDIILNWSRNPQYSDGGFVDDFESYDPFIIENIGDWTLVDGDQAYTVCARSFAYENMGKRMAAMVYAPSKTAPLDSTLFVQEGQNQMLAFFATNHYMVQNDDWVISPELNLSAPINVIRFRVRNRNSTEKLFVEYSTKTDNIEDFVPVSEILIGDGWQDVEVVLPKDAKRVAIHYENLKGSVVYVDDVYIGAEGQYSPVSGYNLYRNGEKINDELLVENSFVDKALVDGEYQYEVEVVLQNGTSSRTQSEVIRVGEEVSIDNQESDSCIRQYESCIEVIGNYRSVELFDVTGCLVYRAEHVGELIVIPTDSYTEGLYLMRLTENEKQRVLKVLIK